MDRNPHASGSIVIPGGRGSFRTKAKLGTNAKLGFFLSIRSAVFAAGTKTDSEAICFFAGNQYKGKTAQTVIASN